MWNSLTNLGWCWACKGPCNLGLVLQTMAVELAEISYVVRPRLLLGLHRVAELVGIVASSSLGHWQAALFWELVLHSWAASLIGIRCVVQPRLALGLQTTMEVKACLAYDGCGTRCNSLSSLNPAAEFIGTH